MNVFFTTLVASIMVFLAIYWANKAYRSHVACYYSIDCTTFKYVIFSSLCVATAALAIRCT